MYRLLVEVPRDRDGSFTPMPIPCHSSCFFAGVSIGDRLPERPPL
ncbi:hypothetical protein [Burkholderia sp. PU8-34]